MRYVAAVTYYDVALEAEQTVLFGTTGFTTEPTDTPANTLVDPRIAVPALVRRDTFDIATTGGASRAGYGELVLRNSDGGLDWMNDVALDGRRIVIQIASNDDAAYPAGYTTLLDGVMEQPQITLADVRIRIRDRQVFTARSAQDSRYGGTNVRPDGVDGIASDLKGKPKPILYGYAFNCTPLLVNTSKLVYQVNDGAVRDVMAVYDSGALLGRGADYADLTALLATGPLAGTFRVWKAGGLFRIGSPPAGQVTCDAVEGQWPKDRTAAQIFSRFLTERAGLTSGDISAIDLTALDAKQPGTIGLYLDRDITVAGALDLIAQSVGAWWASDANGVLRLQRLEAPSGASVATFDGDSIVEGSLQRVPMNDNGLPVYRVTVRAVPNYTVQNTGLVGSVSSARRARLAQPYQDAASEDLTVRDVYLLAPERIVQTLLACLPVAQVEATRLMGLYGVKRDRYELKVKAMPAVLASIDLGVVVTLQYHRYGLTTGKQFRVLGYQLDPVADEATLTVWG